MTRRSLARAVLLGALLHCSSPSAPPAPQLVLYLDTDAPLPGGSGTRGALDPVPLFDRVRFDATPNGVSGSCDCSREFDVTRELVASGAVSFGVFPPLAGHGTLRVRLFRGSTTVQGEPDPGSTIDVTFALPPVSSSEGVVPRTLFLPTDDVGTPLGTTSPVATLPGRPDPSHVGTWPGAVRMNCATAPRVGEVCVPGGAYWMGNVVAVGQGANSGDRSRLVILSPFYVDETEMTVATFRSLNGTAGQFWEGKEGCATGDYCTLTPHPGPNEGLPTTCVDWPHARAICMGQGKDLPTEAQFEYLASGLGGQPYVWGTDVPQCGDAVFERGGYGAYFNYPQDCVHVPNNAPDCDGGTGIPLGGLRLGHLGGPLPPRSGSRDLLKIALPGWTGTVFDLAGNVAEYTLDAWNLDTGPCWARRGIYMNPVCDDPSANERTNRGGEWASDPSSLLAAVRDWNDVNSVSAEIGFRCARPSP